MKDLPEATELVLAAAAPLEAERVPLGEAAGRVAAEPGLSAVDLPPFDRSAMDGYAVRAADTAGAELRLAGEIAAGEAGDRRSSRAPRSASPPARRSRRVPTPCCSPSSRSSTAARSARPS